MKNLTHFQTTRCANKVRIVFLNLRTDYPAVYVTIENRITSKEKSSDAEQQKKKLLMQQVFFKTSTHWSSAFFCLDGHYGEFANACQKVTILPHESYNITINVIKNFSTMVKCVNNFDCPFVQVLVATIP